MKNQSHLTESTSSIRNSLNRCAARKGLLFIRLISAVVCFALSPAGRAVSPPPEGGYDVYNTALGDDALFSLTIGIGNTAVGYTARYDNTSGGGNTAIGNGALTNNISGNNNTATGSNALLINASGNFNTATGVAALFFNNTGNNNTANGYLALYSNKKGNGNTAIGVGALYSNTTAGTIRTASGDNNTAIGNNALYNNTTGDNNIALGVSAGTNLTTSSNNIDIGNVAALGDSGTIRIGTTGTQTNAYIAAIYAVTAPQGIPVIVDPTGRLGTTTSSARFKDNIKPIDKASEAILSLQPVTFRYKHEFDAKGIPQFGLIAEEVQKVNPDLVARDDKGKPYTVRYEAVNAMLLNEFLKAHRKIEEQGRKLEKQEATIAQVKVTIAQQRRDFESAAFRQQKKFESAVAQQQKEMRTLTASLQEQAAQIQKVSDQVEVSKAALQLVVVNKQ